MPGGWAATLGFGAEPYEQEFLATALHQYGELVGAVVDGDAERAQEIVRGHFALADLTVERSLHRAAEPLRPHQTSSKPPAGSEAFF